MYYSLNKELRNRLRKNKIPLWEIAHTLGISEMTLTRWLRFELDAEHKKLIEAAEKQILERRASNER